MPLFISARALNPTNIAAKFALATLGAVITAACAQLAFYLPGNPVPVTGQVFAVALCAVVLGSRLGTLSQLEYLVIGIAGAPVFSGFRGGIGHLLGPTGGYLIGFVVAAFLMGRIAESAKQPGVALRIKACFLGVLVIYFCGVGWLRLWSEVTGLPFKGYYAWMVGAAPFVWLDLAKVSLASVMSTRIRR